MKRPLLTILLACCMLFGADLSGAYSGSLLLDTPDGTRDEPGAIVIKQSGDKLTLSGGPSLDEQIEATHVKLDGDQLTFRLNRPGADEKDAWHFTLTVAGNKLTGTMKGAREGEPLTGKLTVTKQ